MQADTQLLALFCGHFFGDFVFQTDALAEKKAKHVGWVLLHVFIVSATTWGFLGNLRAWWVAGLLFLLHLPIDCIKLRFSDNKEVDAAEVPHNEKTDYNYWWFVGDQILHLLSIIVLWFFITTFHSAASMTNYWTTLCGVNYSKGLILLTGLTLGMNGISVILKYQMASFAAGLPDDMKQGLPKGGKTIGILERLLAFMFVLAGKPEGVGFVVAAKSVFRIGELTNKQDRAYAEYIMIGTLRSFTYALVVAFITKWFMGQIQ